MGVVVLIRTVPRLWSAHPEVGGSVQLPVPSRKTVASSGSFGNSPCANVVAFSVVMSVGAASSSILIVSAPPLLCRAACVSVEYVAAAPAGVTARTVSEPVCVSPLVASSTLPAADVVAASTTAVTLPLASVPTVTIDEDPASGDFSPSSSTIAACTFVAATAPAGVKVMELATAGVAAGTRPHVDAPRTA